MSIGILMLPVRETQKCFNPPWQVALVTVNEIRYKLPGYLYCKYFPSIILGFISYSRINGLSYVVELGSGWRHEGTGKTIRQILRYWLNAWGMSSSLCLFWFKTPQYRHFCPILKMWNWQPKKGSDLLEFKKLVNSEQRFELGSFGTQIPYILSVELPCIWRTRAAKCQRTKSRSYKMGSKVQVMRCWEIDNHKSKTNLGDK